MLDFFQPFLISKQPCHLGGQLVYFMVNYFPAVFDKQIRLGFFLAHLSTK